jgi:hypothetical protein
MASITYPIKITGGINQDIEIQSSRPDTAYKLLNIKNQVIDGVLQEALVNEKGTSLALETSISGTVKGYVQCTPDIVVLFVSNNGTDYIYRIEKASSFIVTKMAEGDFKFGSLIQGVFCYENSEIQKVYWVDGVNQLRYINIADFENGGGTAITDSFYLNTSPDVNLSHHITVERLPGGGTFTAGVIQYAFTYYIKNGPETGIIDMTPLYYISENDRGVDNDTTVGCSFKVSIQNPDTRFNYLRLYSIQRTSLNGPTIVKIVKDIKLR